MKTGLSAIPDAVTLSSADNILSPQSGPVPRLAGQGLGKVRIACVKQLFSPGAQQPCVPSGTGSRSLPSYRLTWLCRPDHGMQPREQHEWSYVKHNSLK